MRKQILVLRKLQEQRVEAKRLAEALESALAEDGEELLDAEEQEKLRDLVEQLLSAAGADDADAIAEIIDNASQESEFYAARRMNYSVSKALTGQTVDELEEGM